MCETLSEMASESIQSYVLTEDMIDAAMTEQYAYQDDIESEEESQNEDSMEVSLSPEVPVSTCAGISVNISCPTSDVVTNKDDTEEDEANIRSISCESPSTSVLVIETGLNKKIDTDNSPCPSDGDKSQSNAGEFILPTIETSLNTSISTISSVTEGSQVLNSIGPEESITEINLKAPILTEMLKPAAVTEIDLCDSDSYSECSGDELMEKEMVDDELQSVMESNLMAEVGMVRNKSPDHQNTETPKISVKSITQISSRDFENMPCTSGGPDENSLNVNSSIPVSSKPRISKESTEHPGLHLNEIAVPNKDTFFSKSGEKLRCIYSLGSDPSAGFKPVDAAKPVSKQVKFTSAPPPRKSLVITPSDVFPNTVTKKNLFVNQPKIVPILPKPSASLLASNPTVMKVVSTYQKTRFDGKHMPALLDADGTSKTNDYQLSKKPNNEQNPQVVSTNGGSKKVHFHNSKTIIHRPQQHNQEINNQYKQTNKNSFVPTLQKAQSNSQTAINYDNDIQQVHQFPSSEMENIIKSLLFHNLKKPYVPPELHSCVNQTTYCCPDCSDRFIFEANLTNHLARRSIHIRYWCRLCTQELQFFNRCVLFKHLRMHNNSIKDLDIKCINISPLAKEAIDRGIITSHFKTVPTSQLLQRNERVLKTTSKSVSIADEVCKLASNSIGNSVSRSVNVVPIPTPKLTSYSQRGTTSTSYTPAISTTATVAPIYSSNTLTPVTSAPLVAKINNTNSIPNSNKISPQQVQNPLWIKNAQPIAIRPVNPSSKIIFLSQVGKPPATSAVQTIKPKEIRSILKVPKSSNNSVIYLSPSPVSNSSNHQTVDTQAPQETTGNTRKRKSQEFMIIDDDSERVVEDREEEEVDIEGVGNECNDDVNKKAAPNNPVVANGKKTSKSSSVRKHPRRVCSECGVACMNISKHLNGNGRPWNNPSSQCIACSLMLPTECALSIHQRIHTKQPPFKCPDCGKDFPNWSEAYAHLKFSCGHLAKCVRYICTACKEHFPSKRILGNHILKNHQRDVFKCNYCPVAFYSTKALKQHIPVSHPDEKCVPETNSKECSFCPKKVVPTDKFIAHVDEHVNSVNNLIYGYKCPYCTLIFCNKMAFVIHQIKEKQSAKSAKTISNESTPPVQQANKSVGYLPSMAQVDEPAIVQRFPEIPGDIEKDPLSLDDEDVPRIKEEDDKLCIICKVTYIAPNSKSSCCEQCVRHVGLDYISPASGSGVVQIVNFSHNQSKPCPKSKKRSPPLGFAGSSSFNKKSKTTDSMYRRISASSENESSFDSTSVKKQYRKKNKNKTNQGSNLIEGQIMTPTKSNQLSCLKCNDFTGSSREEFLDHIKSHRTDSNSYQCLECGLCFVVLPSLERHLQIYHQVKDVALYVQENSDCKPQKHVRSEFTADLKENQCPVCGEIFENSLVFEKHFRGHGRAFMNKLTKSD